jgi:NAD(P)-dependent dehydrogenase (short-subunit alcohol dehydrogenase family)
MTPCNGKTALVTGASRGIGRAAAIALAKAGAQVLVHYGSNAAEARSVVDRIKAASGRAEAVGADLAAPDGAHKLAAKARDVVGGRLDILVANAGISKAATINRLRHRARLQARQMRQSLEAILALCGQHASSSHSKLRKLSLGRAEAEKLRLKGRADFPFKRRLRPAMASAFYSWTAKSQSVLACRALTTSAPSWQTRRATMSSSSLGQSWIAMSSTAVTPESGST